jgi:hypothetical protein
LDLDLLAPVDVLVLDLSEGAVSLSWCLGSNNTLTCPSLVAITGVARALGFLGSMRGGEGPWDLVLRAARVRVRSKRMWVGVGIGRVGLELRAKRADTGGSLDLGEGAK